MVSGLGPSGIKAVVMPAAFSSAELSGLLCRKTLTSFESVRKARW